MNNFQIITDLKMWLHDIEEYGEDTSASEVLSKIDELEDFYE